MSSIRTVRRTTRSGRTYRSSRGLSFTVPQDPAGTWNVLVDTRAALDEPLVTARIAAGESFELMERSAVLFLER